MEFLSYLFIALPYVLALALGVGIMIAGLLCYTHFAAGVTAIVGIYAVEGLYMTLGGLNLGVSLYVTDMVMGFIAVVTLLRCLNEKQAPWREPAWLIFVAIFFFNLLTGIAANGSAAGVQSRPGFYSVVAATYPLSFPMSGQRVRQVIDRLVWLSLLLIGVCIYRWIVYYAPITSLLPEEGSYNPDGAIRVIRSYETLAIAQALVAGLFFASIGRSTWVAKLFSPFLAGVVVALQHRSVWLAAAVGLLVGFIMTRSGRQPKVLQLLFAAGSVALIAIPLSMSSALSEVGGQVARSAQSAVALEGTADERLQSWQAIISGWANAGPRAIALGQPAGYDTSRTVTDTKTGGERKITYAAHNHYVQLLATMGIVGLAAFVFLIGRIAHELFKRAEASRWTGPELLLFVWLLMQVVYYIPYGTDYLQHLIMGTALALVSARGRAAEQQPRAAVPHEAARLRFKAAAAAVPDRR